MIGEISRDFRVPRISRIVLRHDFTMYVYTGEARGARATVTNDLFTNGWRTSAVAPVVSLDEALCLRHSTPGNGKLTNATTKPRRIDT